MEPVNEQGPLQESEEGLISNPNGDESGLVLDDNNMEQSSDPMVSLESSDSIPSSGPTSSTQTSRISIPETAESKCSTCPQVPASSPCQHSTCPQQSLHSRVTHSSQHAPATNDIVQTKVVFVVDTSSHNFRPSHPYVRVGSDLNAQMRMHFIRQFVDERWRSGWFAWSMITFLGTDSSRRGQASAIINSGRADRPVFTKSYSDISQAINRLEGADGGRDKTNYKRALELTERLIKRDSELWQDDIYYQIFFITGTRPWDSSYNRVDKLHNLYEYIRKIVSIRPGRVFLSTAYYGLQHNIQNADPNIPNVVDVLRGMAEAGRGDFFYLGHSYDMHGSTSPCQQQTPTSPCHQSLSTTGLEPSTSLSLTENHHQRILQHNNSSHQQEQVTTAKICPHGKDYHPPGTVCPYTAPPCTGDSCSPSY